VSQLCLRWAKRRHSYAPDHTVSPSLYSVEPIDELDAKRYVTTHHYSGTYPAARLRVGLFRAGVGLVGVAVLSQPCNQRVIASVADVEPQQGVELGRLVLRDEEPANTESWLLARVWRLVREQLPDVRVVVSYSDPIPRTREDGSILMPGHVGTIYQAHNGRHVGRSSPRTLCLLPDGRVISPRALSKIRLGEQGEGYARRQLAEAGCPPQRPGESVESWLARVTAGLRKVRHPGNLCYTWALDRRVTLKSALSYPKLTTEGVQVDQAAPPHTRGSTRAD
jgi:hypothetical protein